MLDDPRIWKSEDGKFLMLVLNGIDTFLSTFKRWKLQLNCNSLNFRFHLRGSIVKNLKLPWMLVISTKLSTHNNIIFNVMYLLLFSHSVVSNFLWPHGLQHTRNLWASVQFSHLRLTVTPWTAARQASLSIQLPEFTQTHVLGVHDAIQPSHPLSSLLFQSFPALGSFQMSCLFASGGPTTGASASTSVLPMNIQGWLPLGLIDLISLQSKGLSRVFSNSTVQKHQFFSAQPSLWSNSLFNEPSLWSSRWGNNGNSDRLYFLGLQKSLQMVTTTMKLKYTCILEEKLWPT